MIPKIFVVEDDEIYSRLIKQSLKDEDYEIRTFETGQEFLDHLHEKPDIVTLDFMLPDYTGMELLKKNNKRLSNHFYNCIIGSNRR